VYVCLGVKGDTPIKITWFKDGQQLLLSAEHHHVKSPDSPVQHHMNSNKNHNKINSYYHKSVQQHAGYKDVLIRHMDDFTSSLSIPLLQPYHTGNYTCEAENNAARVRHTTQLLVNGKKIIAKNINIISFT